MINHPNLEPLSIPSYIYMSISSIADLQLTTKGPISSGKYNAIFSPGTLAIENLIYSDSKTEIRYDINQGGIILHNHNI